MRYILFLFFGATLLAPASAKAFTWADAPQLVENHISTAKDIDPKITVSAVSVNQKQTSKLQQLAQDIANVVSGLNSVKFSLSQDITDSIEAQFPPWPTIQQRLINVSQSIRLAQSTLSSNEANIVVGTTPLVENLKGLLSNQGDIYAGLAKLPRPSSESDKASALRVAVGLHDLAEQMAVLENNLSNALNEAQAQSNLTPSQSPLPTPSPSGGLASWIYGGLMLIYLAGIVVYLMINDSKKLPPEANSIIGIFCAIAGALLTYFFSGSIGLTGTMFKTPLTVNAAGGAAAFVIVLMFWRFQTPRKRC